MLLLAPSSKYFASLLLEAFLRLSSIKFKLWQRDGHEQQSGPVLLYFIYFSIAYARPNPEGSPRTYAFLKTKKRSGKKI